MKSSRPALKQRIGEVIRQHRQAKSWTQEAFADHIEMHRAQYGLVEQGKRDLRVSTLQRVAAGLGESAWIILKEAEGS